MEGDIGMKSTRHILAAGLAVGLVGAGEAHAATAYGYAQQTITNLLVSPPSAFTGAAVNGSATTASAVINGSGLATNSPTDTLQAYQGALPAASQNSFVKYSSAGGGAQTGDFTRGDAVLTGAGNLFTNGVSGSVVAESFVSTSALETGSSSWQVSGTFATTLTSVNVGYAYSNDIITAVSGTGAGPANATFSMTISIKDQHGHEVDASPAEVNTTFASPPTGPELITSGTGSATLSLAGLTAGDVLTVSINNAAFSSAGNTIPEPASIAVIGLGGLLLGRRRR